MPQGDNQGARGSALSEAVPVTTSATNTRPSSASSEFTQISTTDLETDDDIDRPIGSGGEHTYAAVQEGSIPGHSFSPASVELSDVEVMVGSSAMAGNGTPTHSHTASGEQPPPIPSSPPPLGMCTVIAKPS